MLLRKLSLRIIPKYLSRVPKVSFIKNPCPVASVNILKSGFCSNKDKNPETKKNSSLQTVPLSNFKVENLKVKVIVLIF
jgi:hypothetical protein